MRDICILQCRLKPGFTQLLCGDNRVTNALELTPSFIHSIFTFSKPLIHQ